MSAPPHVLLLKSQLFRLGGAEKYTWRIAKSFREKNCRVTLLTSGPIRQIPDDPLLKVISDDKSRWLSYRKVRAFDAFCSQRVQELKADIVFGMDRNRFQTHLRASNGVHAAYLEHRKREGPFLKKATFRCNPLHRSLLSIEKESFQHPELKVLFTNSNMVKEEILNHYSTDPQKIQVIHNGVEWVEMAEDFSCWEEKKQSLCMQWRLPPSHFHFVFIGHNYARKGLEKILHGLSLLDEREFHLSVIGKEKNTLKFQELAKKMHLSEQVSFFGSRSDASSFYQLADCLVIPSTYDPFANVTVEALAMGVFVVSSRTNGGCEVLNSENGRIIDSLDDPYAIAKALQGALKHKKTPSQAYKIRHSVRHLDFSNQVGLLTDISLKGYNMINSREKLTN